MLRLSRRLCEHPGMGVGCPYFIDSDAAPKGPLRRFLSRRWQNFKRRSVFMKSSTLLGYSSLGVVCYWLLCCAVHLAHQPAIDDLFQQGGADIRRSARLRDELMAQARQAKTCDGADEAEEAERAAAEKRVVEAGMQEERASAGSIAPFRRVYQKDFTLSSWEEVEETLQEGDIILMSGEGWLSWAIVTIQFAYSFMRPPALYYSHAAVVVKPAEYRYEDEEAAEPAAPRRPAWKRLFPSVWEKMRGVEARRHDGAGGSVEEVLLQESRQLRRKRVKVRGAVILECMDNSEYGVADVHGDVKMFQVQQVEAEKRLTSTRASYSGGPDVHGYLHCAVRHLRDQERTPRFKEIVRQFVERNEGRPVEESLFFPLAFFSPSFYLRVNSTREDNNVVCCSEMIAELYEELGLFERHWRWVRLTDGDGRALSAEADVSRSLPSRLRIAVSKWIGPRPALPEGSEQQSQQAAEDRAVRAALQAHGLPPPTEADLHPTNACAVPPLRVYERFHGRKSEELRHPLLTRVRPVAPAVACIENFTVLADAELQRRSVEGCATLSQEARAALLAELSDQRRRQAAEREGAGARQLERPQTARSSSSSSSSSPSPSLPSAAPDAPLVSGLVVRTRDGGTAQLQHYFTHNPMATMPYSWTHGEAERVFDWAHFPRRFFAFVRRDSTPEGQWMLKRAARTATASSSSSSPPPGVPAPDDVVLVDVREELFGGDEAARQRAEDELARHPGPRLGEEIRLQRPDANAFFSPLGDE